MGNTLRRFNMEKSGLRICFFGPSGSGKSTCFGFAENAIRERVAGKPKVVRADVAAPLREAQWSVYLKMGLIPNGMMTEPDRLPHDGKLLSFLASHFAGHLGPACAAYVEAMSKGGIAFVNTDCRNNAYESLHDAGFWFVRVKTDERLIHKRLAERGDWTPYDTQLEVERTDSIEPHFTVRNDGTLDELRESVGCAVQAVIFKREDFVRG